MSLAVIGKTVKDFTRKHYSGAYESALSTEIKGIFEKIRQYLRPGQEIIFYLVDAVYPDLEKHVLTKKGVTVYNTRTQKKLGSFPWKRYFRHLPFFPVEVKAAVEELEKLKEANNPLWQLIK